MNDQASFTINVKKTNIPVKVDFLKDDKSLKLDPSKFIYSVNEDEYTFTLSITACQLIDCGCYTFVVSNCFGKSLASALLLIKCKFNIVPKKITFYFYFSRIYIF
jgi:hypothetical protein